MGKAQTFQDLDVWKAAHALVLAVYTRAKEFPDFERFELASQMRRAAVSITANIAEGFARFHPRDKIRFYNISQGSLSELLNYFVLCRDLNYVQDAPVLIQRGESVRMMLSRLISVICGN